MKTYSMILDKRIIPSIGLIQQELEAQPKTIRSGS